MLNLNIEASGLFGLLGDGIFYNMSVKSLLRTTVLECDRKRAKLQVNDSEVVVDVEASKLQSILDKASIPLTNLLTLEFKDTKLVNAYVEFN